MGVFGLFGKEPYSVECARCHESLTINREEVEAGGYKCPVCNGANAIPDSVRAEYKKNRAQDEVRRQEQERKQQEREHKRKWRIRREQYAADVRKQKKPEEQRRARELSLMRCPACNKEVSIKAFSCPHCGHPFPVSLKHCRDCGHEVSIKAGRCPQCGARMPATSQPGMTVLSLVVFVLVVLWCRYFVWPLIEHLFGL